LVKSKRSPDERSDIRGPTVEHPHIAEPVIGRRFTPTRWLMRATYWPTLRPFDLKPSRFCRTTCMSAPS
jgi:hypothetical protein